MPGEPVIAVGNAFGYAHTLTKGIISALHRAVQVGGQVAREPGVHHLERRLLRVGLIAGALTTDAAMGSDGPFDPRIHEARFWLGFCQHDEKKFTEASFESLDEAALVGPRQADGSLLVNDADRLYDIEILRFADTSVSADFFSNFLFPFPFDQANFQTCFSGCFCG